MKSEKIEKSKVARIPTKLYQKIEKRGDGDFKTGLIKINSFCEHFELKPEQIIMDDVEQLMVHIQRYYPENHYNHFHNFPAFMRVFIKRGIPDFSILSAKRPEKVIDKYLEESDADK